MRWLVVVAAVVLAGCGRGPFVDILALDRQCTAVDFVFSIDNSGSMEPHQTNLRNNFGGFIEGIQETLTQVDSYHVGVVSSDAYKYNPTECRMLGALATRSAAPGSRDCGPFASGRKFMTEEDDLEESFRCAASLGTSGSVDELPMLALTNAVGIDTRKIGVADPRGAWYDECNGRDFIRDEALLVTVVITDEADGEELDSRNKPDTWYDALVEAKGREENVVPISFVNGADTPCPVADEELDGEKIAEFTHRFTHGTVGGICEPDYGPLFEQATSIIETACAEYVLVRENVGEPD